MSDSAEQIRTLVEDVVSPLVDEPSELSVVGNENEGSLLIEIRCADSDVGKVIGRQGRIIKSVRTLARAAASRKGLSVEVELVED